MSTSTTDTSSRWVSNEPGRRSVASLIGDLQDGSEMLWLLAKRDVTAKTKQSFLGILWPIVQPLVGAALFVLVFNRLAGVDAGEVPYLLFAFVGSMTWTYVNTASGAAVMSLEYYKGLMTKLYVPRIVLPIAALISMAFGLAVSAMVLVVLLVVYRRPPTLAALTVPAWLLLLFALLAGYSLLFATLQVRYRDTARIAAFANQAWLYASPVAYPAELVDGRFRALYHLNPLAGILGGLRWSLLGSPWTSLNLLCVVGILPLLGLGIGVFARQERSMADHL